MLAGLAMESYSFSLLYNTICGWLNARMLNFEYRGLTIKLYVHFQLCVCVCVCVCVCIAGKWGLGFGALNFHIVQASTADSNSGILGSGASSDSDLPRDLGQLIIDRHNLSICEMRITAVACSMLQCYVENKMMLYVFCLE